MTLPPIHEAQRLPATRFASTPGAAWCAGVALCLTLAACSDGKADGAGAAPPAVEVGVVTVVAMAVPLAQRWITHHELTSIHTMDEVSYPVLRWATPQPLDSFLDDVNRLKTDADAAREESPGADSERSTDDDVE